jgi:DNA polymerase-3 subunit alpha
VAWSLLITGMDPLRYGLIFERFLNPERVSMPDFDIDFCQERRDEVIGYVQRKYGEDRVAQIITFGTLQARACCATSGGCCRCRSGRSTGWPRWCPNNPANPTTLEKAIEIEPRLKQQRDEDPVVANLLNTALQLEGLYRNASTHAAGRGDRRPAADRAGAALPRSAVGAAGHAVQHEVGRERRAGEVRLPRPEDADGARPRGQDARHRDVPPGWSALPLDDKPTYELLSSSRRSGCSSWKARACATSCARCAAAP